MSKTNAAKQLYSILKKASQEDDESSSISVWAKVLGTGSESPQEVSRHLSQLFVLFNEVRNDIEKLDIEEKSSYVEQLNTIQYVMFNNSLTSGKWGAIRRILKAEWLQLLSICGDLVTAQIGGLLQLPSEEVESYLVKIRELINELYESKDLSEQTKRNLISELRNVESALIDYQISGSGGVNEETKKSLGGLLLLWNNVPTENVMKCIQLILQISGAIGAYKNIAPLIESGVEVIGKILTPHS